MIPFLASLLSGTSLARLLEYVSIRSILALLTSFGLSLLFGRYVIHWLYRNGYRDTVRDYGVISVDDKRGTPTMGGVLIITTSLAAALSWCDLGNRFVQLLLMSGVWFGFMGLIDDRAKVKYKDADKGLSRNAKYLMQFAFAVVFGALFLHPSTSPVPAGLASKLFAPFYKHAIVDLGWLYLGFIALAVVFVANSINFADGLDGLAIVPTLFVLMVYGVFAYLLGNAIYSGYLLYDHLPGAGEVAIFLSAVMGAGLGFLWFNAYPAEVFMGDTGALYLGGVVGAAIILLKQELLFAIAGGIFLAEGFSVVLQDWVGIQRVGRRFLFRGPIHHTYQYRGWSEPKIATRFWIIAGFLAVISLATLKLR